MQSSGPRARGEMYAASSKSAGNWRLHERTRDELEAEQRQTQEEALVEGDEQQVGEPEVGGCNHSESLEEQEEEEEEEESASERNHRLLAARARPVCALGTRAHLRRQLAPSCSSSKLVTSESSPKLQHHCLRHHRHKPNCAALRQNLQLHAELAPRQDHHNHNHNTKHLRVRPSKPLISARPLHKTSGPPQLDPRYLLRVAAKQQQQQKRQHSKQLASFIKSFDAPPTAREAKVTSGSQTTTTTMKFISQLYFLIHLSAMISLLLHHKNLVSSERRASYATAAATTTASYAMSLRRAHLANQSQLMGAVMPEPQMQMGFASGNGSSLSANKAERKVRSTSGEQASEPIKSSDILVRLVGRPHARCALQYFLCYLLASSIAILLLLWLIRMCAAHSTTTTTARTLLTSDNPSKGSRQDCTPVLIGSISLGLIQLIVIGLDIADNIDALASNSMQAVDLARHWPILLPFLHFSFVSLLMQFILAKVAENRELIKSASDSKSAELTAGDSAALQVSRRAIASTRRQSSADSKRRADNLQNIALAHLLVTHILLWLMKLNSIGSLQPSDSLDHLASVPSPTLGAPIHLAPPWPTTSGGGSNQVVVTSNETKRKLFPIDTTSGQNNGNTDSSARRKVTPTSTSTTTTRQPQLVVDSTPTTSEPTTTSSSTAPPASTTNQLEANQTQNLLLANVKSERDLRSLNEMSTTSTQRPDWLRPAITLAESPPVRVHQASESDHSNSTRHRKANGYPSPPPPPPPPIKVYTQTSTSTSTTSRPVARSPATSTSRAPPLSAIGVELPAQPKLAASLFQSSLPKRMTAFTQKRPSQRVNSTVLSTPTPTPTPPPQTSVESTTTTSKPASGRHKVRVLVSRDDATPNSIDLTSVIPATSAPHRKQWIAGSEEQDDEESSGEEQEDKKTSTTTTRRPIDDEPPTSERPFPSVESDPPPTRMGAKQRRQQVHSSAGDEREPNESVNKQTLVKRTPPSTKRQLRTTSGERNGTREPTGSEESSQFDEDDAEPDIDLDALLPPVPNYDNSTAADEQEDDDQALEAALGIVLNQARTSGPRRRARQQPIDEQEVARSLRLLRDEAFVFNEAASSLRNTSVEPVQLPLVSDSGQLHNFRRQQQQQQQPTFTEFLLPIVQQYHILVLTILFNMWLNSMQSAPAQANNNNKPKGATTILMLNNRATESPRPEVRHSSSESSGTLESPGNSCSSSTKQLMAAIERRAAQPIVLARMRRSSTKQQHREALDQSEYYLREPPPLSSGGSSVLSYTSAVHERSWHEAHGKHNEQQVTAGSSACSIFFGLLVVSGSLIVILLGLDLLSLLTQCAIQLISILTCLVGLCVIWRLKRRARRARRTRLHNFRLGGGSHQQQQQMRLNERFVQLSSHKSSFHYLFLLAAYYCGLSIALNLGQQQQLARLFPVQVIRFIQHNFFIASQASSSTGEVAGAEDPVQIVNYQLLFHSLLILKGLVLIVQVTVQTVLIRTSWRWSYARAELRQVYNFLMFANLSLWALEICDQQQQMQLMKQQHLASSSTTSRFVHSTDAYEGQNFELLTLDGFTRFASSVVTLSHLYHGLVFMQH